VKTQRNQEIWTARLAMLAVISLPVLALVAFAGRGTPPQVSIFRLRLTLCVVPVLGSLVFLKLTLMDNELLRLVGMTEESLLKLKQVQNQIVQSQKMAALVRFTAGAAHEISNPLTAILGYAELLRDNPGLTAEERLATKTMQLQVHRAQAAIDSMRVVARTVSGSNGLSTTSEMIGAATAATNPGPAPATTDSEEPTS
jgi:signal transduction histidine kinase